MSSAARAEIYGVLSQTSIPSSSSSLKITDRSFRYASPYLWNKLSASFGQPNPDHSFSHSSQPNCLSSSVPSSPLLLSITSTHCPSLLLFLLETQKILFFLKFFPLYTLPLSSNYTFTDSWLLNSFLFSFFHYLLIWFVQQTKLISCRFLIAR